MIFFYCWQLYFEKYMDVQRNTEAFVTQLASLIMICYISFPVGLNAKYEKSFWKSFDVTFFIRSAIRIF